MAKNPHERSVIITIYYSYIRMFIFQLLNGLLEQLIMMERQVVQVP